MQTLNTLKRWHPSLFTWRFFLYPVVINVLLSHTDLSLVHAWTPGGSRLSLIVISNSLPKVPQVNSYGPGMTTRALHAPSDDRQPLGPEGMVLEYQRLAGLSLDDGEFQQMTQVLILAPKLEADLTMENIPEEAFKAAIIDFFGESAWDNHFAWNIVIAMDVKFALYSSYLQAIENHETVQSYLKRIHHDIRERKAGWLYRETIDSFDREFGWTAQYSEEDNLLHESEINEIIVKIEALSLKILLHVLFGASSQ